MINYEKLQLKYPFGINIDRIKYNYGNLFESILLESGRIVIPHIVNDKNVMGSGFVVPLMKHFPEIKNYYQNNPQELGTNQYYQYDGSTTIVNMVAQTLSRRYERNLYYQHLTFCMYELVSWAQDYNKTDGVIYTCLFGAGLAGGDWSFIHEMMVDIWTPVFKNIKVFYMGTPPNSFIKWNFKNRINLIIDSIRAEDEREEKESRSILKHMDDDGC